MSERITKKYRRLFEVRMLHHYWLDDGGKVFDQISDPGKKDRHLLSYNVRSFLVAKPTVSTEKILASEGCLFRETALGFIVAAPENLKLRPNTIFNFVVAVSDSRFHDYTALTLRSQKIYEVYNNSDKTVYRYKENVPYLSNLTGMARGSGSNKSLFLSREFPLATDNQIESLLVSGSDLKQLTSDDPNATPQLLGVKAELPIYLHQGDILPIVPPPGLPGVPPRGIRLTEEVGDDVFALLSLTAERPGNSEFSFIDGQGHSKAPHPIYQIRFKNRSTFWRYMDKRTGATNSTEANPLPLTYFGTVGSKPKPSEGLVKAEKIDTKITRLISEIYV